MNRTLRKRKLPNQPTLNTRSSAAAAASSAETVALEYPISSVNKRIKIEKENAAFESINPANKCINMEKEGDVQPPLESNPAVDESGPVEKTPASTETQKSKTPEPRLDGKSKKVVEDTSPNTPPKPAQSVPEEEKKLSSEKNEVEEIPAVDPYESLSEADRTLFFTDIVGFLKRFTPKYHVPVYRTWSISKSASK